MEWLVKTLREHPEIAIFLALALGFWFGKFKFSKFSLGVVTSTLLAGVLIGQLNIKISSDIKSTFFLMFLFAVGYGVGPQCFRGLRSGGLKQALFAAVVAVACLVTTVLAGRLLGLNAGLTAGLLSGACTISAVLGVASDTIGQLGIPAGQKKAMIDAMPVAYAVTYLFGTAGAAWILGSLGPKLLRVDLPKACKEYEAQLGVAANEPGVLPAYTEIIVRAYKIENGSQCANKTVAEVEAKFLPERVFVERIHHGDHFDDAEPSTVLSEGDAIAISGRREVILNNENYFGAEVNDRPLLDFPVEIMDVVITKKQFEGHTIKEFAESEAGRQLGRGVFLRKILRAGVEMPLNIGMTIDRGDVWTLVGAHRNVERAVAAIGYPDRPTPATDMTFMGFGIVLGALVGALTIHLGSVPLSLSTSGGALIAGLFCGWLRSVHRTFGRIPDAALWVFNNVGLNTFIAVVGITSGPGFVAGLKTNGLGLFLLGLIITTVPLVVGLLAGKYIFKLHPAINLGAVAGARATTAALGAIQDAAKSKVPALGYTVPYAIGNILLITWGVVIVLLMT